MGLVKSAVRQVNLQKAAIASCVIALLMNISGETAAAADPLHLMCEGAEIASAEEAGETPVNHLRFEMQIDRKKVVDRSLSINRFRDGFKNAEAEQIFEPIAHQGEVWISYCNQADWPKECDVQRPAQRDLFISQMSEPSDPLFLSGYVSCAFCPISIFNVVTEGPGDTRFQMFEFDLVKGICQISGNP